MVGDTDALQSHYSKVTVVKAQSQLQGESPVEHSPVRLCYRARELG